MSSSRAKGLNMMASVTSIQCRGAIPPLLHTKWHEEHEISNTEYPFIPLTIQEIEKREGSCISNYYGECQTA